MSISEKLRSIMKLKRISMADLAEKLGKSRQNVYVKFDRNNWSDEDLTQYCEMLGITYEVVFRDAKTGKRL